MTDFVSDGSFEANDSAPGDHPGSAWHGSAVTLRSDGATAVPATPFGKVMTGLQPGQHIEQLLVLVPGSYTLTWSDAGPAAAGPTAGPLTDTFTYRVSFDGVTLATDSVTPGRRWHEHTLTFTASGAGPLRFESAPAAAPDAGGAGPALALALIDQVAVTAAPSMLLPGNYTMLLVGLGISLLAGARRRTPAKFEQ